jgi:hypothetical protein
MILKKISLFILIFLFLIIDVKTYDKILTEYFISTIIEESDIPDPEIQYELPESLIGEFIMISPSGNHNIKIFPNNKYIIILDVPHHMLWDTYGYILKIDEKWYFSRELGHNAYFYKLTEINISDSGSFSYNHLFYGFLESIRKKDIPSPALLSDDISIPKRIAKQQYFYFLDEGRVDYNDIVVIRPDSVYKFMSHNLQINNGIVRISRKYEIDGEEDVVFEGFIEKIEENNEYVKGIIKFTNGVPYYYIKDGTAEIVIDSCGSIKITMFYTPDPFTDDKIPISKEYKFPAELTLEF